MGLITGIASRDGSDIADLSHKMVKTLGYRGNSPFCIFSRRESGWDSMISESPEAILTTQTSFGIVGRYHHLNHQDAPVPYADCQNSRVFLLDGRLFNVSELKSGLHNEHKGELTNPNVVAHLIEELQGNIFDFTVLFSKLYDLIEGMFAGALLLKNHVFLFRDLLGIKPLYLYSGPKYVAFASEQKALWALGFNPAQLLPAGRVVRVAEKGFTSIFQADFNTNNVIDRSFTHYSEAILQLLQASLLKLTPRIPFYMMLSGGLDSTLLATCLKKLNVSFGSLVAGNETSKDIQKAQIAADFLEIPLEILKFDVATLEQILPFLIYHLESPEEKKLNIAFPLFYAAQHLKRKKIQVIFTGEGADELFAGYERHEMQFAQNPQTLHEALWNDVRNLAEDSLRRNDAVAMAHSVELRFPYLLPKFVELSMQIPPAFKVQPPVRKYILRKIGENLNLPLKVTQEPKRAIQFSSGSYEVLKKLARSYGFTKDFVLKHGFFSPTQLFLDSIAFILGFPHIDPKVTEFVGKTHLNLPESIYKHQNIFNQTV
jgi:asparagine synthase (glutamine-hydrolysing)